MKTNYEIAQEILSGLWGNGVDRRNRLEKAGYNYNDVQTIVNALIKDGVYIEPEKPNEPEKPLDPAAIFLDVDLDLSKYDGIHINLIL